MYKTASRHMQKGTARIQKSPRQIRDERQYRPFVERTTDEIIRIITDGNPSISDELFVIEGIKRLRDERRGINSVFSGFNKAFQKHFNRDPIKFINKLASEGKIEVIPKWKGVTIYLPGEGPRTQKTDKTLKKLLG